MRHILLISLLSLFAIVSFATDTTTSILSSSIRSLTVGIEGDRLAPPVLTLGGDDRLVIGFDLMGEEREYLRYSITHCNADWSEGQLVDNEVFDGFNYADIEDYAFSRATTAHYIHYTITLPNKDFRFNISGNYLLKVYPEDAPEETMLQVRFMVQEGGVSIGGSVTSRTDIDYNDAHQQLSLDIDTRNTRIRDINTDLRVVITQNGRLDNAVVLSHPTRLMGSRAIYEHIPALIFPAGNEYRRMETVNNLYPGMGVDHIEYHAPWYHHILNLDKPRAHQSYRYDQTQHGRYFVREYNSEDSDIEADYALTLFSLDMLPIPDADVYLDGDFVLRRFDDTARMEYNPSTGRYEKLLPLKQGAYNYQYLVVPRDAPSPANSSMTANRRATSSTIEGDHYETVNEYLVYVYYRAPGDRYDRLLGVGALFSGR